MDVSGGSGQPRSGNEPPTEHPAVPAPPDAPARDRNTRAEPPAENAHEPTPPNHHSDQAPDASRTSGDDHSSTPGKPSAPADSATPKGHPDPAPPSDTPRYSDTPRHSDTPAAPAPDASRAPGDDHSSTPRKPSAPADSATPEGQPDPARHSDTPAAPAPDASRAPGDDHSSTPRKPSAPADSATPEGRPSSSPAGDADPTASPAPHADEHPEGPGRSGADPGPGHAERAHAHSDMAKGRPPRRPREPGGGLLMGRPFGVPVYVAPSWFLVAALITWVFGGQLDRVLPELGAARYLVSLFFAIAFYASVLVHELAHTVAAIRFGLPVRRIQLQFFGGVSEIEKEAETPGREFVLAFVGPLLSLVLAGLFYLAMQPVRPGTVPGVLLAGLMISNLIVAAFNLLPGLPLDGGRMLRAVVWKITGKPMTGTVAAAWFGRALALSVLVGLPLLNQSGVLGSGNEELSGMDTVTDALLAAILAAIIWTGAGNSLRVARLREHLPELRARALTRRAVPVETDTPLSEALRRANAAGARALVVVDADGTPLALVREAAIAGVPEHRRPWVSVSGLAQELTDGMRVSAELAGEELLDVMRATPATEYLVVEETGEIYGVLSAADVERAFVKAMARPTS
ncbi:site-2 protease family protein [Streptomyces sp. NPDC086787]|uniref:site-2 protease family protein n=1 Tax=Streptomyces sp. NPDC086787 TaxID=3365759 RepID=UPI00380F046E